MTQISNYSKTDDYNLYKVEDSNFPKNTFIVTSKPSREILYNPHIAGKTLQDKMDLMSKIFAKAINLAIKGEKQENIIEFILLSGALYYNLNFGFKKVYDFAPPQCFLGIKRERIEGSEGNFRAVSTYENFESLVNDAIIVMGDTIASGATIVRSIKDLENSLDVKSFKMKKLIIVSLACSSHGARKIKELEDKLGVEIYLFCAEQLFTVMPDGTDLRFLESDSIMPNETKEYTLEKFGEFLGKNMKCAVFDWGTRCKNPIKHFEEFLDFTKEILQNPSIDLKAKEEILRMEKETKEELEKIKNRII